MAGKDLVARHSGCKSFRTENMMSRIKVSKTAAAIIDRKKSREWVSPFPAPLSRFSVDPFPFPFSPFRPYAGEGSGPPSSGGFRFGSELGSGAGPATGLSGGLGERGGSFSPRAR